MYTFVEMFKPYLFGHKFIIQTDHQALVVGWLVGFSLILTHPTQLINKFFDGVKECKNINLKSNTSKEKTTVLQTLCLSIPPPTMLYCELDTVEFY